MNVIIIGSEGFIGKHLFNHFTEKGYNVWGADIMIDKLDKRKYFLIDATESDYNHVFSDLKYDICINCSGASSVPDSLSDPVMDYHLNTVNVFKVLEAIRNFQTRCKFLNLSSAAVYGNPLVLPVREDMNVNPMSPYGFHKLQAEQICKEFWDVFDIPTCSLRIFSVYGPGLKRQLFWDLYKKTITNDPFFLYGTGRESRDFIYILDLIKAVDLVSEFSDFNANVFNVASGREILIKDAVSVFFSLFDHAIKYSFSGIIRKGDPVNWESDISKLISLGYKPSYDLKTGLRKYYEWINTYCI